MSTTSRPTVTDTITRAAAAEIVRRQAAIEATEDLKTVRITLVLNPRTGNVVKSMMHIEAEYDHRQTA